MSDNDWGSSFPYNQKRSSPRIEPCDAPCFNDPVPEKALSIQTKNFLFER